MLCATVGHSLTTGFFGAAPGGVDAQRYTVHSLHYSRAPSTRAADAEKP
jgi:hypothetical protein